MLLTSTFFFHQIQIVLQILLFLGTIYKNCNIKVLLRPKKQFFFFVGFQNYVN